MRREWNSLCRHHRRDTLVCIFYTTNSGSINSSSNITSNLHHHHPSLFLAVASYDHTKPSNIRIPYPVILARTSLFLPSNANTPASQSRPFAVPSWTYRVVFLVEQSLPESIWSSNSASKRLWLHSSHSEYPLPNQQILSNKNRCYMMKD